MKKKILSLLLSVSLLTAAVLPANPVTAYSPSDSGIATDTDGDGLYVNKTATKVDGSTDEYKISLEAFTNGEVSFEEKSVPTDIVLVLDQSGSMADRFTIEGGQYFVKYSTNGFLAVLEALWNFNCVKLNGNAYEYRDNLYYSPDEKNYYKVNLDRTGGIGGAGSTYTYTWTDNQGESHKVVGDGWSSLTDNIPAPLFGHMYRTVTEVTRLEALKIAVSSFVDQVAENALGPDGVENTADDIPHRISIVGFASGASGYQNTELFIGESQYRYDRISDSNYKNAFQSVLTEDGMKNIYNSISSLDAEGATHIDLGMDMAKNVLDKNPINPQERNRAVVVFTDGVPGDYDTDSTATKNKYANAAIGTAKDLKADGTQVFSVGIFDGADDKAPVDTTTSSWKDARTVNRFMHYLSSNYPKATSMTDGGNRSSSDYYFSANDAGRLNEIFETIGEIISKPSIDLDEKTIVKDVMSQYFTVPTVDDVKVYTQDATATSLDDNAWGAREEFTEAQVTIENRTISVTNFNFNENFVSKTAKEDGTYGKKLIIEFTVKPKAGFLGGNNVPTNEAASGVYMPGQEEAQDKFPEPKVNVPIKNVTVNPVEKNVYLMGDLNEADLKAGATVKVGNEPLDLFANNYGLESWQNAFVDITANATPNQMNDLVEDGTYTLNVTVSPANDANLDSVGAPAEAKTGHGTAKINVFKPEITWQDSQKNAGETPNYGTENFVGVEWKHDDLTYDKGSMTGEEPELKYTYEPGAGPITKETPVKVTVKIGGVDVNKYVTFQHEKCDFAGCKWETEYKNKGYHFVVHLNSFDLTIVKEGWDEIDENQSFVFTVTGDNDFSMQVVINGNGEKTIKNLPAGNYTVTEKTNWSWRYKPDAASQTVTAENIANGKATVTFNNTRAKEGDAGNPWKWLNGGAYEENIFENPPV